MHKLVMNFLAIFAAFLLVAGCAGKKSGGGDEYSGFLEDYSGLEKTKDAAGNPVLRFVSPRLKEGGYTKIIVEPAQYYPEPQPNEDVSAETLQKIKDYINSSFKEAVGTKMQVTDQPGPDVLRIRFALTGVGKSADGMQPYQVIPVALVLTTARAASGNHPHKATFFIEAETQDSVSGERLAIAIRSGTGERLKKLREGAGHDVTLESMKALIDEWMQAYVDFITQKK